MILGPRELWELRMGRPVMAAYEGNEYVYNGQGQAGPQMFGAPQTIRGPMLAEVHGQWVRVPAFVAYGSKVVGGGEGEGSPTTVYLDQNGQPLADPMQDPRYGGGVGGTNYFSQNADGSPGALIGSVSAGHPAFGGQALENAMPILAMMATGGFAAAGAGLAAGAAGGAGAGAAGLGGTAALDAGTYGFSGAGLGSGLSGLQTAGLGLTAADTAGGLGTQGLAYGGNAAIDGVNAGLGIAPSATTGGATGLGLSGETAAAGAGATAAAAGGGAAGAVDPAIISGLETGGSQAAAQAAQAASLLPPTSTAASLASAANAIKTGASVASAATGLAGLAGGSGGGLSGGSQTTTTSSAPASSAEQQLIDLQTQLSQKQLDAINAMSPYNQELINQSLAQLQSQGRYQAALDAAITPEDQAAAQAAQFKASGTNAAMQQQLLQMQIDSLKNGGAATDAQKQQIADATDSALASGTNDINTQTQRGISLISDELANSRGLRLSDSPITGEAALLARAGNDQVTSLTKSLRANQANAVLNYPLAVQGLQSGVNSNQQQILQASQQFQNQLQQQAAANRLALTGPTNQAGLGLSGIGNTAQGIAATNLGRGTTSSMNSTLGLIPTISGIGNILSGGAAAYNAFSGA